MSLKLSIFRICRKIVTFEILVSLEGVSQATVFFLNCHKKYLFNHPTCVQFVGGSEKVNFFPNFSKDFVILILDFWL